MACAVDSSWNFGYVKSSLDEISQLLDVESLKDPEDRPFQSKYAAREVLENLRRQLDSFIELHRESDDGSDDSILTPLSDIRSDAAQADAVVIASLEDVHLTEGRSSRDAVTPVTDDDSTTNASTSDAGASSSNFTIVKSNTNTLPQKQCGDYPQEELKAKQRGIVCYQNVDRIEIFLRYIEGRLGSNYIECEETSSGEDHLNQALQNLVKRYDTSSTWVAYVHMFLLNQLGILQAARRNNEKASDFLNKAAKTYETFKSIHSEAPMFPTDLLSPFQGTSDENSEQEKWKLFESEHTQTLYYLAQVYQKADDAPKAAHYCQLTLMRQLDMKQYDAVEWSLNAATLSQYFVVENQFSLARHCLSSAMKVFEEVGDYPKDTEDEGLYSKSLDIKRCWVKYGLALLEFSWLRLVSDELRENLATAQEDDKSTELFDLELTRYDSWMPCTYLLDFDQARPVFLKIQELLADIKTFYTIDNYCSDYIELVQDHSKAFKNLSMFELSSDRRSKMHKRRVDMLEAVTNELNPQYYLLVWRQMVYETAEAYSAMVDCKVDLMNSSEQERPTPHAINKVNSLCEKSIHKYLEYVSSLKGPDGSLPDPLPEGDERPLLVAWFCTARLYYKMMKVDPEQRLECVRKTLMYYKLIVDACDKHPSYARLMETELPACREMAALLPVKIDKMLSRMQ